MVHTNLFKNEIYLIVTSIISIGVLNSYAYYDIALAMLLAIPIINLPDIKFFVKKHTHSDDLYKCATCK